MKRRTPVILTFSIFLLVTLYIQKQPSQSDQSLSSRSEEQFRRKETSHRPIERPSFTAIDTQSKTQDNTTPLNQILQEDQVCELMKASYQYRDLIESMLQTSIRLSGGDINKVRSYIEGLSGDLADDPSNDEFSEEAFYKALRLAGLIEGVSHSVLDLKRARTILGNLVERDPNNGAFWLFLAIVDDKLDAPVLSVKGELLNAFNARSFDPLLMSPLRILLSEGLTSSSRFVALVSAVSRVPVPKITTAIQVIEKYSIEGDDVFRSRLIDFAKKLTAPARTYAGQLPEPYFWNALEYAVGRRVLAVEAHIQLPKPYELANRNPEMNEHLLMSEHAFEDLHDNGKCNRGKLDQLIKLERERLASIL